MEKKLCLLIVEDSADDALLTIRDLEQGGFEVVSERVENGEEMKWALNKGDWDLAVTDYVLPHFSAPDAIRIWRERAGDKPIIVVSGAIGEEVAVEALRAGADDYVMKDRRKRLVPAVERALDEAKIHVEKRQAENVLAVTQARFRGIAESAQDAIITMDADGSVSFWNTSSQKIFGFAASEMIGRPLQDLIVKGRFMERIKCDLERFIQPGAGAVTSTVQEYQARRKNGEEFPIELSVSVFRVDGECQAVGIARDISERFQYIQALQSSKEDFLGIVEASFDAVAITDTKGLFRYVNPSALTLFDKPADELIGTPFGHPLFVGEVREIEVVTGTGLARTVEAQSVSTTWDGEPHTLTILRDVTERRRHESALAHMAGHDLLTGLPNRLLLEDRLNQAILLAKRRGRRVALIMVDLDQFKEVNEELGHVIGDRLLKVVAERLGECVRECDTVGRLSGDEYLVLATDLSAEDQAGEIAQKILSSVARPIVLGEHAFEITCSIGRSAYPEDGEDAETLLRHADTALYAAKAQGRNNCQPYAKKMSEGLGERLELRTELRHAIEHGQFFLHYQPQVDLRTGAIIGVEALIRWQHPERGMIPPNEFIPVADAAGLIEPIGAWVLREACAQNKAWQEAGLPLIPVSVNVSAAQIHQHDFVDLVRSVLAETGLEPRYLDLELTESLMMENPEEATGFLEELRQMGVSIAGDDFGTGYSSLAYLQRLPINRIKIDRAFVRDITSNPSSAAIATAIITMGHSLGMSVLAEGVETEGQLAFLRDRECDEMQGFYFSRPVVPEQMATALGTSDRLQTPEEGRERTLLILDDEPLILSALSRVFRDSGYNVLAVTKVREAFELLAKHTVGVVVSDQRMPEMEGSEFLKRVSEMYPSTIRIILTGYTDFDAVTEAVNEGAIFKFYTKPWDDQQLLDNIAEAFRVHELMEGSAQPVSHPRTFDAQGAPAAR